MYKEQFNQHIIENYPDSEIALLIKKDTQCGFYDVCQKFADASLNSVKFKENDGKLAGALKSEDVNIAKAGTIDFIKKYSIKDIDSMLSIIAAEHPKSVNPDDTRQKSACLREENVTDLIGYAGKLYDLRKIPNEVFQKIVDEIKRELSK